MHQHPVKTVMITGAAGNLGRAVAAAFSMQPGINLVLVDLLTESLKADGLANTANCRLISANLLSQSQVNKCVGQVVQQFGGIDVLCNLAGRYQGGEPVHLTNNSTWDYLHEINVDTVLNTVRTVVPYMIRARRGRIINVAAQAAQQASAGMAAYASAKSSVMRLTEAMAAELQASYINVNCVLPGTLDTPENRLAMPEADASRWLKTDAVADVILFLASDAARAINGAMLPVRGRA